MFYVAIDGGGTKTEGVLADSCDNILARRVVGPSNPNDITPAASVDVIVSLVQDLLTDANIATATVPPTISFFAGIAGILSCRQLYRAMLTAALTRLADKWPVTFSHVGIDSDIGNLFAAEIPSGDGVCVIAGTGSACFVRHDGVLTRIGGWGYLLDSGGCGYSIGRDALEAALRAHDGRGSATILTHLLAEHMGEAVPDALNAIYSGGKAYIASCAPCVFAAAERHDHIAQEILDRHADYIVELIGTARRQLPATDQPLPVVLGGGLPQKRAEWVASIIARIPDEIRPTVCVSVASHAPVAGALILAREAASIL